MRNICLVDLDHTLTDAAWRNDMIGDWDKYHESSIHDKPCTDICTLIDLLRGNGIIVVGLTARPEKWRKLTQQWLIKYGIMIDELLMRPDTNFEPVGALKVNIAREVFGDDLESRILFVLDDRDDVVSGFKALGVTSLQCHGRRYE